MRKLIKYCGILAFVGILTATAAFAFWRNDAIRQSNTPATLYADDIAENYSFNRIADKNKPKNYTLYLFPSTIYLNAYLDYLDGTTSTKPEELFGFIRPDRDDDGSLQTDENGAVRYVCSADAGDDTYLSTWVADGGKYATQYLDGEPTQTDFYQTVYENSDWLGKTGAESYLYGDPVHDRTQIDESVYKNLSDQYYESRHNYRNLHRYDRFGYWPKVSKGDGRYLPLKIEVDENFSSGYYEEVVKRPFTDMGADGWYTHTFALWSYVSIDVDADGNRTGYTPPYYASARLMGNLTEVNQGKYSVDGLKQKVNPALSAFLSTAMSQSFDLMGDFAAYADEEGIIRLFPKYSSGKSYNVDDGKTDAETGMLCSFLNGGGDAVRMTHTYKTPSAFEPKEYYMSYLPSLVTYNGVGNVAALVLPNIALDKYNDIHFHIDCVAGTFGYWTGVWFEYMFNLNAGDIAEIVDAYGDGFYNIYLFIGDAGREGNTETTAFGNLVSDIRTYKTDVFPTLSGKNLFECAGMPSRVISDGARNAKKSIAIALEKVRDMRILTNIPTDYVAESTLQAKYKATNQYFRYLSEDVYTVTSGLNVIENIDTVKPLNARYRYCYILSGVDFTNANTPDFQIRFQTRYRPDLAFSGTGGSDPAPNVDLIYNPSVENRDGANVGTFSKEQRFVGAFDNYFEARSVVVHSDITRRRAEQETQVVFSLKDEEYRGIYDFLVIYIPNEFYSAVEDGVTKVYYSADDKPSDAVTHKAGFYMYAYRRTNVFLKVFAENTTAVTDGFIVHDKGVLSNMLLYQKEYALGTRVRGTDINEVASYFSPDYTDRFTLSAVGEQLAAIVNRYAQSKYGPDAIESVILRDHVSGAIAAQYRPIAADAATENDITVGGNAYRLTFENFAVRKNYIFYVTVIS